MNTHHDAPEHSQERARDIYEKQAKERQQVRKGEQPGASVENLPQLEPSKARDAAGKAVGGRYSFATWEEYVGERWDMTFQRAHDIIQNAAAAEKLRNFGTFESLPSCESHVRELLKLEAKAQPPRHATHPRRLQSHTMHRSRYRGVQEPRA